MLARALVFCSKTTIPVLIAVSLLTLLHLMVRPAQAATITVGPDGTFATIQAALNAAAPGDTLLVQSGTYTENVVISRSVTVRGGYDASFSEGSRLPRTTILNASGGTCPGVSINYACPDVPLPSLTVAPGLQVILDGMEITGSTASGVVAIVPEDGYVQLSDNLIRHNNTDDSPQPEGGGMRVTLQARATLELTGTDLISNTAINPGGGLWLENRQGSAYPLSTTVILRNNIISGNVAEDGGGAHIVLRRLAHFVIDDNTFQANQAANETGGLHLEVYENSQGTFRRNLMQGNRAEIDGGAHLQLGENTRMTLSEARFLGNESDISTNLSAGGLYLDIRTNSKVSGDYMFFDNNKGGAGGLYALLRNGSAITLTQGITATHNRSGPRSAGVYLALDAALADFPRLYLYDNYCNTCSGAGFNFYTDDAAAYFLIDTVVAISNTVASGNGGGGYAYIVDGSYWAAENSLFQDNQALDGSGGGLYIDSISEGSELYLRNSEFLSNTATSGGALAMDNSPAGIVKVIEDNLFAYNHAIDGSGGAIYHNSTFGEGCAFVAFNRNRILRNTATANGGGMHINREFSKNCNAEFNDNIFEHNTASNGNGGGLSIATGLVYGDDEVTFMRNRFAHNQAGAVGGGVDMGDLAGYGHAVVSDNEIVENISGGSGGGIYIYDIAYYGGRAEFRNNIVSRNVISSTSAAHGGGIYIEGTGDGDIVWFTGNVITANIATGKGGGMYWNDYGSYGARYFVEDNIVSDNRANEGGGCHFNAGMDNGGPLYFRRNVFERNVSLGDAGGCYVRSIEDGARVIMEENRFNENMAGGDVGGIYFDQIHIGGALELRRNQVVDNRAGISGTVATGGDVGGIKFRSLRDGSYLLLEDNDILHNRATANGASGGSYGALWIGRAEDGSSVELRDNRVENNVADTDMGGLAFGLETSRLTLDGNTIISNSAAGSGGGVFISTTIGSEYHLRANTVMSNSASANGGLSIVDNVASTIDPVGTSVNNLVALNTHGIVISGFATFASLNDTIAFNDGPGIEVAGSVTATARLSNTILWNNGAAFQAAFPATQTLTASHSIIQGGLPGLNNLNEAPHFVNPSAGNFRLLQSSPAINTADTTVAPIDDLDGIIRPVGPEADRGAYEWHIASVTLETGDNPPPTVPGLAATFDVTVTNTGNVADTFLLDVPINSLGWSLLLQHLPNPPAVPIPLALNPSQSAVVQVSVSVPATATGGTLDELTLRVTSQSNDAVTAAANVDVQAANVADVSIEPDNNGVANTGQQAFYAHTLTNNGNFTDSINLSVNSSQNWTVQVTPGAVLLAPGASTTVFVTVTVPTNAGGKTDVTTVTATSAATKGTTEDTATNTTQVPLVASLSLMSDAASTVPPGSTASYTHTVMNTGNAQDTVSFSYVSSQGWTVIGPVNITLDPGESQVIQIDILVPANAAGLVDVTTITAVSGNDPNIDAVAQHVTTVSVPGVGVEIGPNNQSSEPPGQTVSYQHTLTNTGESNDTFNLSYASSQGWTVSGPASVTLAPAATQVIQVNVTVPNDAAGKVDVTTIVAASANDPNVDDAAQDTTTVPGIGVVILPNHEGAAMPGETIVYMHSVVNTGSASDTYALTYHSSAGWTVNGPSSVQVAGGSSAEIAVQVTMPVTASPTVDVTTITATSALDPGRSDSATDTTMGVLTNLYLPRTHRD